MFNGQVNSQLFFPKYAKICELQKLKFDVRGALLNEEKQKGRKTVLYNLILYQYRMLQIT